jgi:hypothetical protein
MTHALAVRSCVHVSHSRRSPRITEADSKEPNKHDGCPSCRGRRSTAGIGIPLFLELTDDTSYNKVADSHDDGARNKDGLSSPAVQVDDGRNGCEEHDDTDNARCQEGCGISSEVETGKDERGVIQDEVHT